MNNEMLDILSKILEKVERIEKKVCLSTSICGNKNNDKKLLEESDISLVWEQVKDILKVQLTEVAYNT